MFVKKQHIIILGVFLVLICIYSFRQATHEETKRSIPPRVPEKPKILAFYEEGWGGIYAGSWARLQEVKDKIDLISPVWLGLKADGQVNWDKTNSEAINYFNQNRLDFLVLVTSGSAQNSSTILGSREFRQNAIFSIAAYLKRVEATGICLDFEYIQPALKEEFVEFVTELKEKMEGKKLFVAVFPYVNWTEPTKEAYNYQSLAKLSDGLIIMTYDQHRPKDAPGPVAARDWVRDNLSFMLNQTEARKIWLGIAGYGYQWQSGKKQVTALPAWYCRDKAIQKGFKDTYQPETGNEFIRFDLAGHTFTTWWEGSRGMKEKLALAAQYNLAGVALWRLGYEEKEFWE